MDKIKQTFLNKGLVTGRVLTTSLKSFYWENFPNHEVHFNANLLTESKGKIWWGDIDLNLDGPKIFEIAREINEDIYLVKQTDGHFENEKPSIEELKRCLFGQLKYLTNV